MHKQADRRALYCTTQQLIIFCYNVTQRVIVIQASKAYTHLRVIEAGKMNPRQTAAVAPVNWKASQMLGIRFAPKKIKVMSPTVIDANLTFS